MPWRDIRDFLNFLEGKGFLKWVKKEVNVKYEVARMIRETCDTQGPCLLFENVKDYEMPIVGGMFATRRRALLALEAEQNNVIERLLKGINNSIEPEIVKSGPCQEVEFLGDEVDLNKLPILQHYKRDCGAYITSGVTIAKHPETGYRNLSIHRMMLKGRNKLGFYIASPDRHIWHYLAAAEKRREPLEIAVAIGVDPVICIASQIKTSIDKYELSIAGGLRGQPVKTVKCRTVDLEAPSTSEIIIEGEILPNVREPEGPFGEYTGYYGKTAESPIVKVKAITHREDAIYQALLTGIPITENHILKQIPLEATLYKFLKEVSPNVKAVHLTPGGGCQHHAIISIKQSYAGEAKSVALAALGSMVGLKHVIIVDDDIDIFNPTQVEWAIAYRFQADSDLIMVRGKAEAALDPSVPFQGIWQTSAIAIDATRPFGSKFPEVVKP
jgi:UbiD family decarboxylase